MRIQVCAEYSGYSYHSFDLPEGKSWDDVVDHFVKWNIFHFRLKGEEGWRKVDMGGMDYDTIDMKRPIGVEVSHVTEDDEVIDVLEEFD
jgi:hypothetical protein